MCKAQGAHCPKSIHDFRGFQPPDIRGPEMVIPTGFEPVAYSLGINANSILRGTTGYGTIP